MKKTLLILLALPALLISSCSGSDDSAPPLETTSLYGTWDLDYYTQNGEVTENIDCSNQITYTFTNARTYTKTTYAGDGTTNCEVAVIVNGRWEYLGANKFKLSPNGSSADQDINIIFVDDYSKFRIDYSSTYTEVFAKKR